MPVAADEKRGPPIARGAQVTKHEEEKLDWKSVPTALARLGVSGEASVCLGVSGVVARHEDRQERRLGPCWQDNTPPLLQTLERTGTLHGSIHVGS